MVYTPITEDKKAEWIKWLDSQVAVLNGFPEDPNQAGLFKTPEGDAATAKDLVGNLLATLSNQTVTIN